MATTTIMHFLIISAALLVVLLPLAKAFPLPYSYCGSDDYDFPKSEKDYAVKVTAVNETLGDQPISFNVTAHTDKLLTGGKLKIVFSAITGEVNGGNTLENNLCDVTIGGCPIHPGDFTIFFNKSFRGVYNGNLTIYSKSNKILPWLFGSGSKLLTCVIYLAITVDSLPQPPPSP